MDRPIVVCGAGIGGLATALSLARHGLRSIVLERASSIAEIGAGIQLGPNAFQVLDALGLNAFVRASAVFVERCRLLDALTAETVADLEIDAPFLERFGHPYAVVHRAELHAGLREACVASGVVDLRTNALVTGYEQTEASATAVLASGERVTGAALVGADGLWSSIRRQMVGDTPPRVSGHTTYRAVVPAEAMPAELRWNMMALWAGPRCHIVHYPLSGGHLYNLVVTYHNDASAPAAGVPVAAGEVLDGFRHIHPVPLQVITAASDWRKWVLCDREPLSNWVDGKVALLGDAAHPTMQYMAQGACMAMEDGLVLASEIAGSGGDIAGALQAYQRRRLLRTARIVLLSREMGDHVFHPSGTHAALRNEIMRGKSQAEWHDTLSWLYNPADLESAVSHMHRATERLDA